jgi:hypothetical protein
MAGVVASNGYEIGVRLVELRILSLKQTLLSLFGLDAMPLINDINLRRRLESP